jgi:hypothetical protein
MLRHRGGWFIREIEPREGIELFWLAHRLEVKCDLVGDRAGDSGMFINRRFHCSS